MLTATNSLEPNLPVTSPDIRPTWVDIDLGAVRENAVALAELTGSTLYAVVKADAYGLGAVPVARALAPLVSHFAVSLVEEGVELREAGIDNPILIMGPALDGGYEHIVRHDMIAMVSRRRDFDELRKLSPTTPLHLKIDTGMGRLGFYPDEAAELVASATGIATHFACADVDDPADPESPTHRQLAEFERFIARVDPSHERVHHAANSGALVNYPQARFDAVRPGLVLYGNAPGPVRQVVRFCTRIAQLREVTKGTAVGYGHTWRARQPSRLAVLPVGYADGFPRSSSNNADVLIGGVRCPVVGTVSMDMTIADVTGLGEAARVGDEVVLLGSQGDEHIAVAELAERTGLTPYEVTCGISKRVPRHYR